MSKKVLIIDDDRNLCAAMETILEKEDFQVVSTFRSKESLGFLKKGAYLKINLVITDLQMPGLGGFSIIKDIQGEDYDKVPVLVITGRNLDPVTMDMIKHEPNVKGIYKKPLSVSNFVAAVYKILGILEKPQNPAEEAV